MVMGYAARDTPSGLNAVARFIAVRLWTQQTQQPTVCLSRRRACGADEKSGPKVVNEMYDELVFWEPTEALYNRVKQLGAERGPVIDAPDPVAPRYSEQAELSSLLAIRHRVAEDKARILSKSGRG